ncbi:MAG: hypothetical protein AAGA32_18735, partial [Pseudomonadota bacterium]
DRTDLLAGDELLAAAPLDRPLHRSNVLAIERRSNRPRALEAPPKNETAQARPPQAAPRPDTWCPTGPGPLSARR